MPTPSPQIVYRYSLNFGPTLGLLGVLFVTLKLLGVAPVAAWSWWLVTLPFWGGFALVFGIIAIIIAVGLLVACAYGIFAVFSARKSRRKLNDTLKAYRNRTL